MSTTLAPQETGLELLERVVIGGDLSKLSAKERLEYYQQVCASVGLNPLTRPLEYIQLSGKLTLYARRDATDQLRQIHKVSVTITGREKDGGVYAVTARATNSAGRTDESIGAVPIEGLKGEALANALMKAETKAKRRVTLSICGLGMLDETELETIPASSLKALPPEPHRPQTETEPASGREEVPAAWEVTVQDFVEQFDGATTRDDAEGWRVEWLKVKTTVPADRRQPVEAAMTRARTRLGAA